MSGHPILSYHSLDDGGSTITLAPSQFHNQMSCLRRNGYKTITLKDYVDFLIVNVAVIAKASSKSAP